jgi:hypothetical protein
MGEMKIRVLVSDDQASDRKQILQLLSGAMGDKFNIDLHTYWEDAKREIQQASQPFDFVFTDMVYEFQDDARLGGKHIVEAVLDRSRMTRIFLVSKNWSNRDILNMLNDRPNLERIPKNAELSQEEFNEILFPQINVWCRFKSAQFSYEQREDLRSKLYSGTIGPSEKIGVGSEIWQCDQLFPHLIWENKSRQDIYQEIMVYLISYPVVEAKMWHQMPSKTDGYTLPILEYYQELYFNPDYASKLKTIRTNARFMLTEMFKHYVFELTGRDDRKKEVIKALGAHMPLLGGYKNRLEGQDSYGNIAPKTIHWFIHKLTGRLIAIGAYLFLNFTKGKIQNILMDGNFKGDNRENRGLFTQHFFIGNMTDKDGMQRFSQYQKIFCNCSEDERDILREWWMDAMKLLEGHLDLTRSEIDGIKEHIAQFIPVYLNPSANCLDE